MSLDHIEELAELGLGGLEAEHPDHDDADVRLMRDMAANLGLFVTGSSDYHGANKDIAIGRFTTHPAALEELGEMLLDCADGEAWLAALARRGVEWVERNRVGAVGTMGRAGVCGWINRFRRRCNRTMRRICV